MWSKLSSLAVAHCRSLTAALPPLEQFSTTALRDLAHLHLKSSGDLMTTLRVLVPGAFKDGSPAPNMETILNSGDNILGMLSNLVELQMFHLLRAQAITAQLRMRVAQRQQHQALLSLGPSAAARATAQRPRTARVELPPTAALRPGTSAFSTLRG